MYNYSLFSSTDDINEIVETIKELQKDGSYKDFEIDENLLVDYLDNFKIDNSNGEDFILLAKNDNKIVGFLAGTLLHGHYMFNKTKVGQCVVWWVHRDHRKTEISKELMSGFEEWGKTMKCKYLMAGHYDNEYTKPMQKMYTKQGYTPLEYSYIKEMK